MTFLLLKLLLATSMGLFYNAPSKDSLKTRNTLLLSSGIPALKKHGFDNSPFTSSYFGRNNQGDFSYDFCRVNSFSQLEIVTAHISRGDSWIKIFLNVFELHPNIKSLEQLKGVDGLQFHLPPNSVTSMRLRIDSSEFTPFRNLLFEKQHKLGRYFTKRGFENRAKELGHLIENDLNDIDHFVKRWHTINTMLVVDWNGKIVNI